MLHGNIELNHVVIGEWSASRKSPKETKRTKDFNDYECYIWYRGTDGYRYEARWEIWGHFHGNGALSLAARVMQEGMSKARKALSEFDKEDLAVSL